MYLPKHFRADARQTRELLEGIRAADLITATGDGLFATFLPLIYVAPAAGSGAAGRPGASGGPEATGGPEAAGGSEAASGSGAAGGELGALLGHVARKNDHWRLTPHGESLVIAHGPDAYISPGWYASKRQHGRVVPTWNYLTTHIHGELLIHDDPAWLESLVRRLTARHESDRPQPWSVDDAPRDYTEGQLRAIVGLELRITRVEAKAKLGQNRSSADIDGVIDGLRSSGDERLADATARGRDL